MKHLKNYALLLPTVLFILLGAAMPKLVVKIQDAQVNALQKKEKLSAVNLTLRQEGDVGPVLQLMSKKHTEGSWEGETVLSEGDASHAALTIVTELNRYGLLSETELEQLEQTDVFVEPQLLVGEDGSSALIWACTWDDIPGTFITLDDATGKAVRILISNPQPETDSIWGVYLREKWVAFLQDYYEIELTEVKEATAKGGFCVCFSSKDGMALYNLNLEITNDCVFFNYQ